MCRALEAQMRALRQHAMPLECLRNLAVVNGIPTFSVGTLMLLRKRRIAVRFQVPHWTQN